MTINNSEDVETDAPALAPVELLVCSTCRMGEVAEPDVPRPGALLHAGLANIDLPDSIKVRAVACLSNCSHGCTIAVRSEGRWTYIYGNIDPATQLETVVEGVTKYASTKDGLVPWRERPEHFRKNCIARIPPIEVLS